MNGSMTTLQHDPCLCGDLVPDLHDGALSPHLDHHQQHQQHLTCRHDSQAGRTGAVREAHVVLLLVVISLFTLALTVAVGGARRLLHLILSTNSAPQTFPNVVPQLGEGARGTRLALAPLRRRAARTEERARRTAVTLHGRAGDRVGVREGVRSSRGHIVHQSRAQSQQQDREERERHLEGRRKQERAIRKGG